jgi:hypothetical protein
LVGDALFSPNLVGDTLLSPSLVGDALLSPNFVGEEVRSPTVRTAESSREGNFLGVSEGATDNRLRPGTCAKNGSGVVSADLRRSWMACEMIVSWNVR